MSKMIHFKKAPGVGLWLYNGTATLIGEIFENYDSANVYLYNDNEAIIRKAGSPKGAVVWEYFSSTVTKSGFPSPEHALRDYIRSKTFLTFAKGCNQCIDLIERAATIAGKDEVEAAEEAISDFITQVNLLEVVIQTGTRPQGLKGAMDIQDAFGDILEPNAVLFYSELFAIRNLPALREAFTSDVVHQEIGPYGAMQMYWRVMHDYFESRMSILDNFGDNDRTFVLDKRPGANYNLSDMAVAMASMEQANPGLFTDGQQLVFTGATDLSGTDPNQVLGQVLSRFSKPE